MNTKKVISILAIFLSFIQFAFSDGYKVPQYAYTLDVCDIDNDGDIDIILGSNNYGSDTISILINDGFGNFSLSYLIRSNFVNIICSCINSDNLPDIVSHSTVDSAWVYYPNNGDGTFGNSVIISKIVEQKISLFNLDQDNSPDFTCYDESPAGIIGCLLNNGSGTFSHYDIYTSPNPTSAPDVGDLNGDGLNDIITSTSSVGPLIFYNQGNGVFDQQILDITDAPFTYIFDIDNDGYNEIGLYDHVYFPGGICKLRIYKNQDNNFIIQDTISFPLGTLFQEFADFNNDGYFDIVYSRSFWRENTDSIYIAFNDQHYDFSVPERYFVLNPRIIEVRAADLDGNGYNDIAYTHYNWQDSITILFNDGTGKFVENPLTSIESREKTNINVNVFPNPFNLRTKIHIGVTYVQKNDQKLISIYDIRGNIVKIFPIQVVNSNSDNYETDWDGKDNYGRPCASGIYLLNCIFGNLKYVTKIILVNN
jgi:hypothetical protein